MKSIIEMKDENGNEYYPKTVAEAVTCKNGENIESELEQNIREIS